MPSSAAHTLLRLLFLDLSGARHILTLHVRCSMSTVIEHHGGTFRVERPAVVERLHDAVLSGAQAALVLRTFTTRSSHTGPRATAVPVKQVRGWRLNRGLLLPLDQAQMFDAHCIDPASGEPIPPEPGVEYTEAPTVDLSELHP